MRSLIFKIAIFSMAAIGGITLLSAWSGMAASIHGISASNLALGIYAVLFWILVTYWIVRRKRSGKSVPVPIVGAYVWYRLEAPLAWLSFLWSERRRARVARFLKTANDLRVREKGINRSLPRHPDG